MPYKVEGSIDDGDDIITWTVRTFNSRGLAKLLTNRLNEWVKKNNCFMKNNPDISQCELDDNFRQGIDGVIYSFNKIKE